MGGRGERGKRGERKEGGRGWRGRETGEKRNGLEGGAGNDTKCNACMSRSHYTNRQSQYMLRRGEFKGEPSCVVTNDLRVHDEGSSKVKHHDKL